MFSLKVIDTDNFLDMSPTSQLLYFHLSMRADDDGFVSNPRKIMKIANIPDDDMKVLIAKQYIIPFESGVCVIKDWKIHNYIQADRYQPTHYQDEKKLLTDGEGGYKCIQNVYKVDTQVRLGKVRLGKVIDRESNSSLEYLKDVPKEDLLEFKDKGFTESMVKSKAEDLLLYCQSKGKIYRNYKAFLLNALNKDYGKKTEATDKYSSIKKITINNDNNTK